MGGRMHPHLFSLGTLFIHPCTRRLLLANNSTFREARHRQAASSGSRGGGRSSVYLCVGDLPDGSFASGAPARATPVPVRRPRTEESHAAHLRWHSACC